MASWSNNSIMQKIDELKEKMSDEVYLALCDRMKKLYTDPCTIPVRIWFMSVNTFYVDHDHSDEYGGQCGELYKLVPVQQIVMMSRCEMNAMKNMIDKSSTHTTAFSFNDRCNVNTDLYKAPWISHVECHQPQKVEVFRVEEI
jgi:hypothetical protein